MVGVQPFGGHGLSGTGPKAGGPLYVRRLVRQRPADNDLAELLAGPVGESDLYALRPKGAVLCIAGDPQRLKVQHDLVRATGNRIAVNELDKDIAAVLFAGSEEELVALNLRLAERPGRIVAVHLETLSARFPVRRGLTQRQHGGGRRQCQPDGDRIFFF